MIALMLAAATALVTPPERPNLQPGTLREIPAACREGGLMTARRDSTVQVRKLADLPKARLMLPVVRSVEGCAVPTFVRYDVEGDGRFAKPAQ